MTKTEFAVYWLNRNECPGCRNPLRPLVIGRLGRHRLNGMAASGGDAGRSWAEEDLCGWDTDDLTSLVLIGTGVVVDRLDADRVQVGERGSK